MSSIALVESVDMLLDPERETRVNAYRLIHAQRGPGSDVRWCFFAKADLSKPGAMTRARQWHETSRHPDRPGMRHQPAWPRGST